MTHTWVRLRRERGKGYMMWSSGARAVRVMQTFADGARDAEHVLDVRAFRQRSNVSPLPALARAAMPWLRKGTR